MPGTQPAVGPLLTLVDVLTRPLIGGQLVALLTGAVEAAPGVATGVLARSRLGYTLVHVWGQRQDTRYFTCVSLWHIIAEKGFNSKYIGPYIALLLDTYGIPTWKSCIIGLYEAQSIESQYDLWRVGLYMEIILEHHQKLQQALCIYVGR